MAVKYRFDQKGWRIDGKQEPQLPCPNHADWEAEWCMYGGPCSKIAAQKDAEYLAAQEAEECGRPTDEMDMRHSSGCPEGEDPELWERGMSLRNFI
jgi:hypothetical protein